MLYWKDSKDVECCKNGTSVEKLQVGKCWKNVSDCKVIKQIAFVLIIKDLIPVIISSQKFNTISPICNGYETTDIWIKIYFELQAQHWGHSYALQHRKFDKCGFCLIFILYSNCMFLI